MQRSSQLFFAFFDVIYFRFSLTARDEDAGQSLTYTLTNDDSGRFSVDFQGRLYKAKDVDYETQNYHLISAMVQDNGNPSLAV